MPDTEVCGLLAPSSGASERLLTARFSTHSLSIILLQHSHLIPGPGRYIQRISFQTVLLLHLIIRIALKFTSRRICSASIRPYAVLAIRS